jgi:hypothetical protein
VTLITNESLEPTFKINVDLMSPLIWITFLTAVSVHHRRSGDGAKRLRGWLRRCGSGGRDAPGCERMSFMGTDLRCQFRSRSR